MRCLYCGNELALLKKLTGGGEFCSEAHRQKYQEEYNRLALSRLLQAQPEPLERPSFETPAGAPARSREPLESSQPVAVAEAAAPALASRPVIARRAQPAAPAEPGFVMDRFEPVLSPGELIASEPYLTPIPAVLPRQLPDRRSGPRLHEPESVALPDLQAGWNNASRTADHGIDPREFARSAPLLRISLEKIQAHGLGPEREPLEVVLNPARSTTETAWSAGIREFEFRLAFALNAETLIQPLPVSDEELPPRALVEAAVETVSVAEPLDQIVIEPEAPPANAPSSDYQLAPDAEESAAIECLPPPEPEAAVEATPESEAFPPAKIPKVAEGLLNVVVAAASAPPAKPAEMHGFSAITVLPVTIPNLEPAPLRSKMVYGARPAPAVSEPGPAVTRPEMETAKPPAPAGKREQKRNGKSNGKSAPAPAVVTPLAAKPVAAAEAPPEPVIAPAAPPPNRTRPQLRLDELPAPKMAASLNLDDLRLTLEHSDINSPIGGAWSRMNMPKRIAISAGLLLALVIAGFLLKSSFAKAPPPASGGITVEAVGPSLIAGDGSWTVDWNAAGSEGRQISLFRPSLTLADYRIEFQGQIESKSIGWVFRAANPRNYYVTRIEMRKPGLNPTVVIAHYAVINGEETQHVETPLPFPVHIDTEYKVRSDIYGSHFNTYLQEKLVDSWSDNRLKSGGFGLSSERTDRPQIRRVQLFELRAGK